ncbi:MAG TPA: hypothetical protein VFZ78_04100 [Flavisolibacter sp.]
MKRTYIILLVVLVIVAIGWYGYSEYNRTNEDLLKKKPAYSMQAAELIAAFEKDTASANRKFTDKVIQVSGTVKSLDTNGNPVVIALGDPGQMSSVQCSMDSSHAEGYRKIREGDHVTLKGMCTGGKTEEMFGTDVILNRSVALTDK